MDMLVNIDVDDLKKAIDFYGAVFDLKVGRRFGDFGVEMVGGEAQAMEDGRFSPQGERSPSGVPSRVPIYLLVKAAGTLAGQAVPQPRDYRRHWTPVHLDFVVDDIEAAVERAKSAGAQLEKPITTSQWGKLAVMADPFGHGFCFVQFIGRGYDEIAD